MDFVDVILWCCIIFCTVLLVVAVGVLIYGLSTAEDHDVDGTVDSAHTEDRWQMVCKIMQKVRYYYLTIDGVEYECKETVYNSVCSGSQYTFILRTDKIGTRIIVDVKQGGTK